MVIEGVISEFVFDLGEQGVNVLNLPERCYNSFSWRVVGKVLYPFQTSFTSEKAVDRASRSGLLWLIGDRSSHVAPAKPGLSSAH
jgi:hypothetical protein